MITKTQLFLYATRTLNTMGFSGVTVTSSVYLNGPGGQAGNGFPLPRNGLLTGLYVWDGTTLRSDTDMISFVAGDKLSVYCQNAGSNFTVKARLNGNSTSLEVPNVPFNTTQFVVVEFTLNRD